MCLQLVNIAPAEKSKAGILVALAVATCAVKSHSISDFLATFDSPDKHYSAKRDTDSKAAIIIKKLPAGGHSVISIVKPAIQ